MRKKKTDATLFNRFWLNYVNQINEGKILTSHFNLNEIDIFKVKNKFNTKIFVKDAYYYINKIFDYNPVSKSVTKVELLKLNDPVVFVPDINTTKPVKTNNEVKTLTDTYYNDGGGTFGSGVEVSNNNFIKSVGTFVKGKGNTLGLKTNGAIVVGNNNYISDNIKGAFLIGSSDKIITEDNVGYVGDVKFKDGKIVNGQIGQLTISNGIVENLTPYKSAQLKVVSNGTNDPTLTVLYNDTGIAFSAFYSGTGEFDLVYPTYDNTKIFVLHDDNVGQEGVVKVLDYNSTSTEFECRAATKVNQFNIFFEIRFYP